MAECEQRQRYLSCVGIAADGTICWGKTSEVLLGVFSGGQQIGDTLDALLGLVTVDL